MTRLMLRSLRRVNDTDSILKTRAIFVRYFPSDVCDL